MKGLMLANQSERAISKPKTNKNGLILDLELKITFIMIYSFSKIWQNYTSPAFKSDPMMPLYMTKLNLFSSYIKVSVGNMSHQ